MVLSELIKKLDSNGISSLTKQETTFLENEGILIKCKCACHHRQDVKHFKACCERGYIINLNFSFHRNLIDKT